MFDEGGACGPATGANNVVKRQRAHLPKRVSNMPHLMRLHVVLLLKYSVRLGLNGPVSSDD